MSTSLHLSAPRPAATRNGSARTLPDGPSRTGPAARRPDLERQSITFTIGLYLFICAVLLGTHLVAADQDVASSGAASTSAPAAPSGAATHLSVTP